TSNCSFRYRFRKLVHISAASGPVKGTGPKEAAAVTCSERCSWGLLRSLSSSGVPKFGGRREMTCAALASAGTTSPQRRHHALSWGLAEETVVHQGSARPSCLYHSANGAAMWPSARQPCPGAPSGDG